MAVLENVPKLQGKDKVEDILKEALKEVIRCPSIILYYSNHQRSFKSFHSFFLSLSLIQLQIGLGLATLFLHDLIGYSCAPSRRSRKQLAAVSWINWSHRISLDQPLAEGDSDIAKEIVAVSVGWDFREHRAQARGLQFSNGQDRHHISP